MEKNQNKKEQKKEFKIPVNKTLRVPEKWNKERKHKEILLSSSDLKA